MVNKGLSSYMYTFCHILEWVKGLVLTTSIKHGCHTKNFVIKSYVQASTSVLNIDVKPSSHDFHNNYPRNCSNTLVISFRLPTLCFKTLLQYVLYESKIFK